MAEKIKLSVNKVAIEDGSTNLSFVISEPSEQAFSVEVAISDHPNTFTQSLLFLPGETTKKVALPITPEVPLTTTLNVDNLDLIEIDQAEFRIEYDKERDIVEYYVDDEIVEGISTIERSAEELIPTTSFETISDTIVKVDETVLLDDSNATTTTTTTTTTTADTTAPTVTSFTSTTADGSYGTATLVDSFDVSSQETAPNGLAFSADGTKMFVTGNQNNEIGSLTGVDVNEYTLSTGFDVSTASFVDSFDVSDQEIYPSAVQFNTDGTKMFVTGTQGDDVNEYTLSTGFDVSTASFVDSFDYSSQEYNARALAFNNDGTKMFVVGTGSDAVNEYTLSTGFDVSTASFVDSYDLNDGDPDGLAFNADGTKMFVTDLDAGGNDDDVSEYTLSTGFDVSTASFVGSLDVSSQDEGPSEVQFNTDGTKMFVLGYMNDNVYEYSIPAINITATTSESVQSGDTITVTLDTGDTVVLTAASAGTTLTGTYSFFVGDNSSDLTVSSFAIGSVTDSAGNAMTSTTLPSSNIADTSDIVINASVLIDGIVEGVEYLTTSGMSGLTNQEGLFNYQDGDDITFKVGGVVLGTATAEDIISGRTFLQDIADVERSNLSDDYLENMAIFLQSLDANYNPGDGITITEQMRTNLADIELDLRQASSSEVKQVIEQVGGVYVERADAMEHVKEMLIEYSDMKQSDFELIDTESLMARTESSRSDQQNSLSSLENDKISLEVLADLEDLESNEALFSDLPSKSQEYDATETSDNQVAIADSPSVINVLDSVLGTIENNLVYDF